MLRLISISRLFFVAVLAALVLAACSQEGERQVTESGKAIIAAWAHAGQEGERKALQDMVARFNDGSEDVRIELTILPTDAYNSQVQSAALADDLPDVLEFDGPFLYNYVWQGHIRPLDGLLSEASRENLIKSIIEQGTYRDKLYSVGMYDSGLVMYGRRSMLEEAGARISEGPEDAWTVEEFDEVLHALAENDDDGQVLDLKRNYSGEWFTYAFSPAIKSAGGDLIDGSDFSTASGVLNGPEAVEAMTYFQRWVDEEKLVDLNVDDNAFAGGRVALSWVGHWEYPRYSEAHGDDLVLLPLPDFGNGSRTGQGSWNWGITESCENPDAAIQFIEFLIEDEQILQMTEANAAVPGTKSAIAKSELYAEGGPLHIFVTQLEGPWSMLRPRTPAYAVITSVFQQAFQDIIAGSDVQEALDQAVDEINEDIESNEGYPSVEGE